jgi:succinoglycan biosynthesis protein ExoM
MNLINPDRISVCICTFRRPDMLARLLDALADQRLDSSFSFDIVVVDNDSERSAESTVRSFQLRRDIETIYDCEPERNISMTRNRAIRNAVGNLIAFVDDDEYPVQGWLADLHRTLKRNEADGVLGPVLPEFPAGAPDWLRKGHFFKRRRIPTDTRISLEDGRTGNVLLRKSIFVDGGAWFDPAFGRTGGEDSDFFQRQFRQGRVFVWCDEAAVHETVLPERWRTSYYLRRYLRSGTVDGELMRAGRLPSTILRHVVILGACTVAAPFSLLLRKHVSTRVFQKLAYCGGILTAYCGMSLLRHRD